MVVADVGRTVSIKEIRPLYGNRSFKPAFDYLAGRAYASRQTTVDRLQAALKEEGHEISRQELVEFFKALEKVGCGVFVVGRKGRRSRFEWRVSLLSVGKAAAGESTSVEAISETEVRVGDEDEGDEIIDHPFTLRPGLQIVIALPQNITAVEASRVADFVRTLPFER